MEVDEIRRQTSMYDVLRMYGLKPNSHMMMSCPFHGKDKNPSMKIYKDGYKCFTCNKAGDIFAFVQEYDGLSFHEAFVKLGGTSGKMTREERKAIKEQAERRERVRKAKEQRLRGLNKRARFWQSEYSAYNMGARLFKPMSEMWCFCINSKESAWGKLEMIREEVEEVNGWN